MRNTTDIFEFFQLFFQMSVMKVAKYSIQKLHSVNDCYKLKLLTK